jgi:large subunit ribosomal protein L17
MCIIELVDYNELYNNDKPEKKKRTRRAGKKVDAPEVAPVAKAEAEVPAAEAPTAEAAPVEEAPQAEAPVSAESAAEEPSGDAADTPEAEDAKDKE